MNKPIGSKVNLNDLSNEEVLEFRSYIEDIWESDTVKRLDNMSNITKHQDYNIA